MRDSQILELNSTLKLYGNESAFMKRENDPKIYSRFKLVIKGLQD